MVVLKPRRPGRRRRTAVAVAAAACAHLLALAGARLAGARSARLAGFTADNLPSVQITLVRPPSAPTAPASPASGRARPSSAHPEQPQSPAPPAPVAAPQGPGLAQRPGANCEPEDLLLLIDAEKPRAGRNQIEVDKARRLARESDDRAAKQMAQQAKGGPLGLDRIPDREARLLRRSRRRLLAAKPWAADGRAASPGRSCSWEASRDQQEHSEKIEDPCPAMSSPPQGCSTEEWGITLPQPARLGFAGRPGVQQVFAMAAVRSLQRGLRCDAPDPPAWLPPGNGGRRRARGLAGGLVLDHPALADLAPGPTSNCGLTSARLGQARAGAASCRAAGKAFSRPMKLASHTISSGDEGSPRRRACARRAPRG